MICRILVDIGGRDGAYCGNSMPCPEHGGPIPDAIEPLIGYRGWMVYRNRLISMFRPIRWSTSKPFKAKCLPDQKLQGTWFKRAVPVKIPDEFPPAQDCKCGAWACYTLADAQDFLREYIAPLPLVYGLITAWGKVLKGPQGFRASIMRPAALIVGEESQLRRLSSAYGIPVVEDGKFRIRRAA